MHLTLEIYLLILRHRLPAEILSEVGREHRLDSGAPHREGREGERNGDDGAGSGEAGAPRWEEPRWEEPRREEPLPEDWRHLGHRHLARWQERMAAVRRRRRTARDHLRHLLQHPPESWRGVVEQARQRYRTRAFAELLIEESRRRVRNDPRRAEQLAALVPWVVQWIPGAQGRAWARHLELLAEAWRANALRVRGDLPAAERVMVALRRILRDEWIGDDPLCAEIDSLEASLRTDQRRWGEAEALLERSVALFRRVGDPRSEANALVKQANLRRQLDRPEEALPALRQAADLLRDLDPRLYVYRAAMNGRIVVLCDLGRFREAREAWEERHRVVAPEGGYDAAILRGLHGRIRLGLGRPGEAAAAFLEARREFLALDRPYDAALVSLDLAQAWLEAGRVAELKELAADLVPQFRARGVQRETLAALRLLAAAIHRRDLSRSLLVRLRRRLSQPLAGTA